MNSRLIPYVLWFLVLGAVTPAVVLAVVFFPIIVLFGNDPPGQTRAEYLLVIARPFLAVAGVIILSVVAGRMFEAGRVRAALALAAALFASVWYFVFLIWR